MRVYVRVVESEAAVVVVVVVPVGWGSRAGRRPRSGVDAVVQVGTEADVEIALMGLTLETPATEVALMLLLLGAAKTFLAAGGRHAPGIRAAASRPAGTGTRLDFVLHEV